MISSWEWRLFESKKIMKWLEDCISCLLITNLVYTAQSIANSFHYLDRLKDQALNRGWHRNNRAEEQNGNITASSLKAKSRQAFFSTAVIVLMRLFMWVEIRISF